MKAGPTPILILLLASLAVVLKAKGQPGPEGYWLQHFTDESGLPQNSVKAIAPDRNGFVWLATEAGLVRFDGHHFMTFEKSVVPISSNRIRGFVPATREDTPGRYHCYALAEKNEYIGIQPDGLVSVDTAFYRNYQKYNPFSRGETRHNSILASLPSLNHIDPAAEHYFFASDKETYYIWQKGQVNCFRKGRLSFTAEGHFRNFFLIGSRPYALDYKGNFLAVGAPSRKVAVTGEIVANDGFTPEGGRYRLFWNNISRQAFLYLNKALYSLTPSGAGALATKLILKDFDFDALTIVSAFFEERSGFLFLGSLTKGLFVVKKDTFYTHKMDDGSADNVYYAQVPGPGLSVLTAQGYLFTPRTGIADVTVTRTSPLLEKKNFKFCMAQSPDGTFWFGLGFDLYKMDRTGRKTIAYVRMPEKVKSILTEPDGNVWIGCETDALYAVPEREGRYEPRLKFRLGVPGLTIVGKENRETLFLATEAAFFRLNTRTGAFRKIRPFENMTVRSTYTTSDGTWITTYGNGIFLLKEGRVFRMPPDRDRFLATAHCIAEDRRGFFWITTNRGLFQVAKKQWLDYAADKSSLVYYLFHDKTGGFETNEFNGGCYPCALTLADGTVSLPSMDGLVWYKPEEVNPGLPEKGIFINTIQEDGKELGISDTLTVSRAFEQLRIRVTTPYMGNIRNVQMHYLLSGVGRQERWRPVGADFVIPVSNVGHGEYTLKIRKITGFGPHDYTYKTIYLRIPKAWYESWRFQLPALVLLAALFFLSVKWRTAYLAKKEREANLIRHYRVISQIMAAVNHDIQTPLHYIGYSLRQFNAYLHKHAAVDPAIVRMSDETLNTSRMLKAQTKNVLDYISLQSSTPSKRLEMTAVDVAVLVSEVAGLFEAIATLRGIPVRNTIIPGLTVYSDANLLPIVVHNLIDNALKVARSEIVISGGTENGLKQITIENDGKGIPGELASWLNKNFRSYDEWLRTSQHPGRKGIGLVIVKDLCVLLGIDITATTPGDDRTSIRLTFRNSGAWSRG